MKLKPKTKITTWGDLLNLPEAPHKTSPRATWANVRPSPDDFPNSLEDVSKHFSPIGLSKTVTGPLSLRLMLGISQAQLGRLLSRYTGKKSPTRSTVSLWERIERGQSLPVKYQMTDATRGAYARLIADLVALHDDRLTLRARLGKRSWSFVIRAHCKNCQRSFTVTKARAVNCPTCIRKGKKK